MLNNNNFQLKINNFWDMVSDMNDIHMELWNNRNDSQLKPEPDEGTLEILSNIEAIESFENQNNMYELTSEELSEMSEDELFALCDKVLADMDASIKRCESILNNNKNQIKDDNQVQLELELAEALADIDAMAQPTEYEVGINNIQEYLATDNGSQIEYDDDMDEIDRRNVYRYLEARRVA